MSGVWEPVRSLKGQSWGKAGEAGRGLRVWDPRLGRVPQELRTWRDLFMMAVSGRRLS